MRHFGYLLMLFFGAACVERQGKMAVPASPAQEQSPESRALHAMFAEYDEELLHLYPVSAMFRGDYRYNDKFTDSLTPEFLAHSEAFVQRYLTRALAFDAAKLNERDQVHLAVFVSRLQLEREGHENGWAQAEQLLPLSQFFSLPNFMAVLGSGSNAQPFKTVKDYDDWLARLQGFYSWAQTAIANMRRGMKIGVVQPRVVMERTLPQLWAHVVDDPATSIFYGPIKNIPASFPVAERERLTQAYGAAIRNHIVPTYKALHDFVQKEYLPRTRASVGLSVFPNGAAWYSYLARMHTTTALTPQEIRAIGMSEVARITAEMEQVKNRVGFSGDLNGFFAHLRTDPRYYHERKEDLLNGYRALKSKVDARLDRVFDVQPRGDYIIRAVEEFQERSQAAAYYMMGTPDGSRPGMFFVNTYDLRARPIYSMTALSLHEAAPGHHFQISLQQELDRQPSFRRFSHDTAFAEGWGLYAESLGEEMGLYDDPYQRFGRLAFELWRANRLVVDTGLHADNWTRQQAIDWLLKTSPITETDAIAEVERYIANPGQALAYKIGQLKISQLRKTAEQSLGERFDIRAFHRKVLEDGSMPLDVLEARVGAWLGRLTGAAEKS